jgi:hypothetical protein
MSQSLFDFCCNEYSNWTLIRLSGGFSSNSLFLFDFVVMNTAIGHGHVSRLDSRATVGSFSILL